MKSQKRYRPKGSSSARAQNAMDTLKKIHDEAFVCVSEALTYEKLDDLASAGELYHKVLERLDSALDVHSNLPDCEGTLWNNACKIKCKMIRIRKAVNSRLKVIDEDNLNNVLFNASSPGFHGEVKKAESQQDDHQTHYGDTEVLLSIESGVKVFFVSANGSVTSPPTSTNLCVHRFGSSPEARFNDGSGSRDPCVWLQVGAWIYPLVPNETTALRSNSEVYFFPDSGDAGATIGIQLPSDLSADMHSLFETLMKNLTAIKYQSTVLRGDPDHLGDLCQSVGVQSDFRVSHMISDGIVSGSEILATGLNKAAELSSKALRGGAWWLRQYLQPTADPVSIDPRLKEGMVLLGHVTGSVREASEVVANKVADLVVALGERVAKNVARGGGVASSSDVGAAGSSTVSDVFVIASGGVKGISTLYVGLEKAAKTLASSFVHETVQIVDHKYGDDVALVVGQAIYSVGNVAMTTNSIRSLGFRRLAKRTAKETGKAILEEFVSSAGIDPSFGNNSVVASRQILPK